MLKFALISAVFMTAQVDHIKVATAANKYCSKLSSAAISIQLNRIVSSAQQDGLNKNEIKLLVLKCRRYQI
jgi:hypothetical protein